MGTQNNTSTDCNAVRIRELNDRLRKTFTGGHICITGGITERCDTKAILAAVQAFDAFNDANDPYREHDFGAIDVGELIKIGKHPPIENQAGVEAPIVFFKMDYYANGMQEGSSDPTDPAVTERVLTIFLAEEY